MSSNMAIPAVNIGGNIVQPTPEGKIQVTTAKGKVKVLSQDQFVKQIKKNEENIKAGKDFEIKKDNPTAKVLGFAAAAAAIVAGVVYRKDLAKLFKSAGEKISDAASNVAEKLTGKKQKTKRYTYGLTAAEKQQVQAAKAHVNEFSNEAIDAAKAARKTELAEMKKDAQAVFKDYDADKALNDLKDAKLKALKANGIKNEAEFEAIKLYAKPETKEIPEKLPTWARDKETCQRYAYSVDQSIAKAKHEAFEQSIAKAEAKPKAPKAKGKNTPAKTETTKAEAKPKTKKAPAKTETSKTETKQEAKPKAETPKAETKQEAKPKAKTEDKK
uniref:hypothetical protein n=1 Tax=Candidatus Scatousia sp. TaxID=3085663 RepID=UPI004026EF28